MKTFILSAVSAADIAAGMFVKADGSGAVVENDTAGSELGIAESSAVFANPGRKNVGVIKQGLVTVTGVAATYKFGDKVEVATDGQSVQAFSAGALIGTVAEPETKALLAPGPLKIFLSLP